MDIDYFLFKIKNIKFCENRVWETYKNPKTDISVFLRKIKTALQVRLIPTRRAILFYVFTFLSKQYVYGNIFILEFLFSISYEKLQFFFVAI